MQLIHSTAREFLLRKDESAKPYHLDEAYGDAQIASMCCRHIRSAFLAKVAQEEADDSFSQSLEKVQHLCKYRFLIYALTHPKVHLRGLQNRARKLDPISMEFKSFIQDLRKKPRSYATLLWTARWMGSAEMDLLNIDEKLPSDASASQHCCRAMAISARSAGDQQALILLQILYYKESPDLFTVKIYG